MYVCVYACVFACVCVCVCVHVIAYSCVCTCMCAHVHGCVHTQYCLCFTQRILHATYMYCTYTHTHTHTHCMCPYMAYVWGLGAPGKGREGGGAWDHVYRYLANLPALQDGLGPVLVSFVLVLQLKQLLLALLGPRLPEEGGVVIALKNKIKYGVTKYTHQTHTHFVKWY